MGRQWRNRLGAFMGGITGIIVFAALPMAMAWRFVGCGIGCIAGVITGFYADKIIAALWQERVRTFATVIATQQAMRKRFATIRQKASATCASALQWRPPTDEIMDIKRYLVGTVKLAFVIGAVGFIISTICAYETKTLTTIHYLFMACFSMTLLAIAIHGFHLLVNWIRADARRQRTIVLWAAMGTWMILWGVFFTMIGVPQLLLMHYNSLLAVSIILFALLMTFVAPWTVVHDMEWSRKHRRTLYAQPNGALRLYGATLWDTTRLIAWSTASFVLSLCWLVGLILLLVVPIILPFCFIIFMGRAVQKMVERSVLLCLSVTLIVTMTLAWSWHPTDVNLIRTWLAAFAAGALSGITTEIACRGIAYLCGISSVKEFFTAPIEHRLNVIFNRFPGPIYDRFSRIAFVLISFGEDIQEELGTY